MPMSDEVIRIGIVGTESTGKSALAADLACCFEDQWAPEYVRTFWDQRGGRITARDLPTIARGQIANEEAAAVAARRIVFCDTTLLMNVRWADDLYEGRIPAWMRQAADRRSANYRLHLYCEPDLPWAEDPQRTFAQAEAWQASAERVRAMLTDRNLPHASIQGAGEQRIARAIEALAEVGIRP